MVVVGGRQGIPGEEPIPVICDLMSRAVEILWWKPPPQQQQPTGKVQMLNSVMELYNNTHLSDVTLVVEDRHIPAHRHVLATHSQMFDRMWNHSMKEVSHLMGVRCNMLFCSCIQHGVHCYVTGVSHSSLVLSLH